ncbi:MULTISPECIES: hypothetical protein [Burkholderia]|nr:MULTISPECIES: hypothetical protein [Burkholderia]
MNTLSPPPTMDNRARMRALCTLAGSQGEAARLIAKQTSRPCSLNAVKSWTCDPDTSRARTCHDWAVEALEKALKKLNKAR